MRSAPGIEETQVVVCRGVIVSTVGAELSGLGFRRQNKLKI